jgi:hypothetical protein
MKMLNNVLIKMTTGGRVDLVLYLDNVPEDMFYEMRHPRKCAGEGSQQHWEPDTSKPMIPTLYEELHLSQTGDNGIVFDLDNEQARARFQRLDRYVKSMYPANQVPPEAVPYAMDPTDSRSPALALDRVPRVVLPSVLSPRGDEPLRAPVTTPDLEKIKAEAGAAAIEQYKMEVRMQAVRDAKAKKAAEEAAAAASQPTA